jgi:glucose-6-phosphate isomerase
MNFLKQTFNNINFEKNLENINNNEKKIFKIIKTLNNLSALNIVKNTKLLEETIEQVGIFCKNKKNFLVFGTGGSNLGARALINILQSKKDINIDFFDNIDPVNFKNSIDKIDLIKTGFIVISKSGSTPETLSQFACLIEIFDQQNNLSTLFQNSLIITEDQHSPLNKIAKANKCKVFKHEKDIGGRYSIFSNVGMIPAIIAGLNVRDIHAGAVNEISNKQNNEFLKIAQFFRYQTINNNLSTSVLLTYSDALFYFGKWYLQLWAESLGKNKKGITAIHAVGTTDQHSQLQLYLDGPKDKFFTFYTTDHAKKGLKINRNIMQANGVNYLVNKTMGDLMHAEQQATMDTFRKNKFPFREINLPEINEYFIGRLVALSIMETVATCIYFDVNPFNQPAVEQGKLLTKKYLS